MITVYVWNPHGEDSKMGHASMRVDGGTPPGSVYISYWPDNRRIREYGWIQPTNAGQPRVNFSAVAFENRTFDQDVDGEGRQPDHVMRIGGLDETALKTWWQARRSAAPLWDTTSNNCSTTVAEALRAGGADRFTGVLTYWSTHNFIWTPSDIVRYVGVIQRGQAPELLERRDGIGGAVDRAVDYLTRGW
jgi:hypothetical protein